MRDSPQHADARIHLSLLQTFFAKHAYKSVTDMIWSISVGLHLDTMADKASIAGVLASLTVLRVQTFIYQ